MKCIKRDNKKEDVIYFNEINSNSQYILLESKIDNNYLLTVDSNNKLFDISTGCFCGIFSEKYLEHYNVYVHDIRSNYLKKLRELLNEMKL